MTQFISEKTETRIQNAFDALDKEITEALAEQFCQQRANYSTRTGCTAISESGKYTIDSIDGFGAAYGSVGDITVTIVNDNCTFVRHAQLIDEELFDKLTK